MHLIRSVKIVEAFTALNAKKGLLRIGIHVNAKKKVPQGFEPRQTDDLWLIYPVKVRNPNQLKEHARKYSRKSLKN